MTPVGTRAARANTQSSDGDQSSGRVREVSLCPAVRRAGSSHTAIHRKRIGCRIRRFDELLGGSVADRHRVAERREVVGGDRRRDLVGVDRLDSKSERREAQRIAADSAAEVGDALDPGIAEARRVPARRPRAGSPARVPRG